MGIIKSIQINHFEYKIKRNWDCTYWFFDIHGTILKPNYSYGNTPTEFYPYAKETLQFLSGLSDIVMVIYTCSHPHEIEEYVKLFKENNINFKYINENPEVKTQETGYGCYDKKPYMNVLFEDKASFDPEVEWKQVLEYMKQQYKKINDMEFAIWLNKNRWYNYDEQHKKWCYTFEGGTSISRKSYEKDYMKTSEELYLIFENTKK